MVVRLLLHAERIPGSRYLYLVLRDNPLWSRPEDDHAVGEEYSLAEVVRNEEHRLARRRLDRLQFVLQLTAGLRVERTERLVEDQHLRRRGERTDDHRSLPHASGELVGIAVLEAFEVDHRDQVANLLAALLFRDAFHLEHVLDIFLERSPGKQ